MGQLTQSLRENPPKSFPSDTEKNLKQCMVVNLRSGKELDQPKKDEKTVKEVEHKNMEMEEKMKAKENNVGVELNNKGNEQKSDEVILPCTLHPYPFPKGFEKPI